MVSLAGRRVHKALIGAGRSVDALSTDSYVSPSVSLPYVQSSFSGVTYITLSYNIPYQRRSHGQEQKPTFLSVALQYLLVQLAILKLV